MLHSETERQDVSITWMDHST